MKMCCAMKKELLKLEDLLREPVYKSRGTGASPSKLGRVQGTKVNKKQLGDEGFSAKDFFKFR